MATNHLFVDYENVQADNLDLLADRQVKAVIFLERPDGSWFSGAFGARNTARDE